MLEDVTAPQQLYLHMYPIILTSYDITRYLLRVKTFQNILTQRKRYGVTTQSPPPSLYYGGGTSLHVRPRVKFNGNKVRY